MSVPTAVTYPLAVPQSQWFKILDYNPNRKSWFIRSVITNATLAVSFGPNAPSVTPTNFAFGGNAFATAFNSIDHPGFTAGPVWIFTGTAGATFLVSEDLGVV